MAVSTANASENISAKGGGNGNPPAGLQVTCPADQTFGTNSGANNLWASVRYNSSIHTARNNIFFNLRTGGTGSHFAAGSEASGGSYTANDNVYAGTGASATPSSFMDFSTTPGTPIPVNFATWQASISGDANSQAGNPGGNFSTNMFVSAATGDLHLVSGGNPLVNATGNPIAGITTDYDGELRHATTPNIGSDELESAPVPLRITPSTARVGSGLTLTFSGGGGVPPYVFSFAANNSGGSITASGFYTAGASCAIDAVLVTDAAGSNATATVSTDATAPVITCPANLVIESAAASVPVTFAATATDDCTASPVIVCTPPSGSFFGQGTTTVTCRATDSEGNTTPCSFLVTVQYPLTISPTNTTVAPGGTVEFIAYGGTQPYTFSFVANNSGGSIDANIGEYFAGPAPLTDVVRVTDAANRTVTATVMVRLIVPGTATPYLAGLPDGSLSTTNAPEHADVAPDQSPVQVPGLTWPMPPNRALSFRASGGVLHYTGSPVVPPDGTSGDIFGHWGGAEHGIADFQIPVNALVGLFLGADSPEATPAPARLDFTSPASRDYALLEPLLKQVFFIGDGLTSGGQPQLVRPPTGATRLYLATVDSYGWWNNVGSLTVSLSLSNLLAPLVISPATTNARSGATIAFSATGGLAPYQFVLATNNSGGTLTGGSYTAGPLSGTDAVRVTDAAGSSALAFVTVTANVVPVAPAQNFVRAPGLTLKIKITDLLAACSDADGGTLALDSTGASVQGATIVRTSAHLHYTLAANTNDSFPYAISDGQGGTATNTITVTMGVPAGGLAQNIIVFGGAATVKFFGIPGYEYDVQRTTSLVEPVTWTTLNGSALAPDAVGAFSFTDSSAPNGSAYYRSTQH